jgi:hypothetical protein
MKVLAKCEAEDPVQIGWVLIDGIFTNPNQTIGE